MGVLRSGWVWMAIIISILYFALLALQPSLLPKGPLSVFLHTGWLMFLVKLGYDHSDRLYKIVQQTKAFVLNTEVNWDGQVIFSGVQGDNALERISDSILKHSRCTRARALGPHEKLLELEGGTITLRERPDGDAGEAFSDLERSFGDRNRQIVMELHSNRTTYRAARRRFDDEVVHTLHRAKAIAQPVRDLYTLRVRYAGSNPYFGLYVRRLGLSSVVRFDCDFREKIGGRDQEVTIRKDRLEIVADEIPAFNTLVIRHLAIA